MAKKKNFIQKTGYFFEEIVRSKIVLQAVLVGLIAGILVVLFKLSINGLFNFIQTEISGFSFFKKLLIFPVITTMGGLISGLLVFKIAPETRGSGIPYVKMTLARVGNMTRLRSILVKFFAGVAGIGTGLSLGREGPSVQLGAGSGALVGKLFNMNGTDKDKLIAAGAGSAIGATFNAPIAGTVFVLEELLQKFSSSLLFPVLVATVTAASVARFFLGNNPSFQIPYFNNYMNESNIVVCIILGFVAGILGVGFAKLIYMNNSLFAKMKHIPNWAKPAIAGFVVGIAGLFVPLILGSGNHGVDLLLEHKLSLIFILLIFIVKFFITPFCFGSGAAGGIFLPMLMLGAFLGYMMGLVSNFLGFYVNPVVIALVGMGAFLSAVARTPITAAVMVFEMTGGYNYILPIMLSAAIADLTAEKLNHKPIYSTLILKQSKDSEDAEMLSKVKAKVIMTENVQIFDADMPIKEALAVMEQSGHSAFPVADKRRRLIGIITKSDIEDSLIQSNKDDIAVEKIMNPAPVFAYAETDLYTVYYRLHFNNTEWAIITDKKRFIQGIITRLDIHNFIEHSSEN